MADEHVDDDIDVDDGNNPVREQREHIKNLESQIEERDRQIAVSQAGLDLSDKQFRALTAAHDGEWNADAVKETATDLGFVKAETPDTNEGETQPADQTEADKVAEATSGAPADPTLPSGEEGVKQFRDFLYETAQGSGPEHLAKLQAEFESRLREAGGGVVTGTAEVGGFVPQ